MAMNNHEGNDRTAPAVSRPSRRARLQALLFTGAALGTALVALGILAEIKMPRAQGE